MGIDEIVFWFGWLIWISIVLFSGLVSLLLVIFTFGMITILSVFGWTTLLLELTMGWDLVKVARDKKKRKFRTWLSYL